MKTFVIAYTSAFDGGIKQKLVQANSKAEAICEYLSDLGYSVTLEDCFEEIYIDDMFITAMELTITIYGNIVEVKNEQEL